MPTSPEHHCHAMRCETPVPPKMLMCRRHWFMVPASLRRAVWAAYRPGQEITKTPSEGYLDVMLAAIEAVDNKERESLGEPSHAH